MGDGLGISVGTTDSPVGITEHKTASNVVESAQNPMTFSQAVLPAPCRGLGLSGSIALLQRLYAKYVVASTNVTDLSQLFETTFSDSRA